MKTLFLAKNPLKPKKMKNKKKVYKLISISTYGTEIIDEAETLSEANQLKKEYEMAFGNGFSIKVLQPVYQSIN